jgi:hypothetical protein
MAIAAFARNGMRMFTLVEIAEFVGKDRSTVRKWFENLPGVLKYPRGAGNQKPTLDIPESIARAKLVEIGHSLEAIEAGLIEPHDRRLMAEPEPVVLPRKRGRPRKTIKSEERRSRKRMAS